MSYAGVERQYSPRCRPEQHDWLPRGDCHLCGVTEKYLIAEAKAVLKLYGPSSHKDSKSVAVNVQLTELSRACQYCGGPVKF